MTTVQKVAMGLVGVALATSLLLPDRQTVPVIGAIQRLLQGSLNTAIRG